MKKMWLKLNLKCVYIKELATQMFWAIQIIPSKNCDFQILLILLSIFKNDKSNNKTQKVFLFIIEIIIMIYIFHKL